MDVEGLLAANFFCCSARLGPECHMQGALQAGPVESAQPDPRISHTKLDGDPRRPTVGEKPAVPAPQKTGRELRCPELDGESTVPYEHLVRIYLVLHVPLCSDCSALFPWKSFDGQVSLQ